MRLGAVEDKRTLVVLGFGSVPLMVILFVFALPYFAAIREGFSLAGDGHPPPFIAVIAEPALRDVILFTLKQAAFSTLAALVIGLPGAWLIGAGRFRAARLVRALASIPFAMPPILVVLGFVLFFGNAGWANKLIEAITGAKEGPLKILYKPQAIILAHAFYNFPIVLRLVGDGIARARASYASAAKTLGASDGKIFLTVLIPLASPSLAAAALLVFLYCFTSFAVVLVLGGGPAATTLPVEIYRAARVSLNFQTAGVLAFVETTISAAIYGLYTLSNRATHRFTGMLDDHDREDEAEPRSNKAILGIALYFIAASLLVIGPILSVPVESFLSRNSRTSNAFFSFRWWASIRASALPALARSVLLASVAATIATTLAASAALARWIAPKKSKLGAFVGALCVAPLASSGIVLGLGWIRMYGPSLSRSFWAVAFAHAVAALPFAYRSISEGLSSLSTSTADASYTLGAAPARTALFVALPASVARIRSAWAFSAAISLGELNAVLMLGLEKWETLPLLVYRAAGAYRFGAACAAGSLLALSCAGAFFFSEISLTPKKRG